MEELLPFLIAGPIAVAFAALAVWGWRKSARMSELSAETQETAAAFRTPAVHPAAEHDDEGNTAGDGEQDFPDHPTNGSTDAPLVADREDFQELHAAPAQGDLLEDHAQPDADGIVASPEPFYPAEQTTTGTSSFDGSPHNGAEALPDSPSAGDVEEPPHIPIDALEPETRHAAKPAADVEPEDQRDSSPSSPSEDASRTDSGVREEINAIDYQQQNHQEHPSRGEDELAPATHTEAHADALAGIRANALDESGRESRADEKPETEPETSLISEREPELPNKPSAKQRRSAAVHRDRRGKRRTLAAPAPPVEPTPATRAPDTRPAAEAKLRLSLHPIRRTASLSVVLTRPEGFPERVTIPAAAAEGTVAAYNEQRYDDLDLPWTADLLDGEIRLASADGFQWIRSARQVHIFAEDPIEPELISVGAARPGISHTLICRFSDTEAVRSAAASAGSSDLQTHEHWQGIPEGWTVLSDYMPVRAAASSLPAGLRTLDPGSGLEIGFEGGLMIRSRVYAAGHPPRIRITPAPGSASVTIGGETAVLSADGAWEAPGWDAPGQHLVDIVPGPSLSYEIAADPWTTGGWQFWDAHSGRFGNGTRGPWAQAEICGAQLRGPAGETILAAESQPTLIALGAKSGATDLRLRDRVAVSVGMISEPPAFLLSATGQRRTQGRVIWLGLTSSSPPLNHTDPEWVAAVRAATCRHLPLECSDALGEETWQKAKERARRLKRRRHD